MKHQRQTHDAKRASTRGIGKKKPVPKPQPNERRVPNPQGSTGANRAMEAIRKVIK